MDPREPIYYLASHMGSLVLLSSDARGHECYPDGVWGTLGSQGSNRYVILPLEPYPVIHKVNIYFKYSKIIIKSAIEGISCDGHEYQREQHHDPPFWLP